MSLRFGVVSGDGIKNLSELPSSQNKGGNTNSYLIHSDHEIKRDQFTQLFLVLELGMAFSWRVLKVSVAIETKVFNMVPAMKTMGILW